MKSQRQWSLARVTKTCRSAPAVWLALERLAADKGTRVVTPTRDLLCKLSGLRSVKTTTLALNALESAGWVDRAHFPAYRASGQRVTLLKIILRYTTQKTTHIGTPPGHAHIDVTLTPSFNYAFCHFGKTAIRQIFKFPCYQKRHLFSHFRALLYR